MSALGHKRTSTHVRSISALPPEAEIDRCPREVRFVPEADQLIIGLMMSETLLRRVRLLQAPPSRRWRRSGRPPARPGARERESVYPRLMTAFICTACGNQYPPSEAPPDACLICTDERQFVPASGQSWTTLERLRNAHSNKFRRLAAGLTTTRPPRRSASGSARSLRALRPATCCGTAS